MMQCWAHLLPQLGLSLCIGIPLDGRRKDSLLAARQRLLELRYLGLLGLCTPVGPRSLLGSSWLRSCRSRCILLLVCVLQGDEPALGLILIIFAECCSHSPTARPRLCSARRACGGGCIVW